MVSSQKQPIQKILGGSVYVCSCDTGLILGLGINNKYVQKNQHIFASANRSRSIQTFKSPKRKKIVGQSHDKYVTEEPEKYLKMYINQCLRILSASFN